VKPPVDLGVSLPEFAQRLTPTEQFNRRLAHQRMADELEAKILADRAAHPAPVPLKVKPRWFRLALFPLTMRKFERVFFTQGEGFVRRWWQAWTMAKLTVRR
jgi:hypothetical protein